MRSSKSKKTKKRDVRTPLTPNGVSSNHVDDEKMFYQGTTGGVRAKLSTLMMNNSALSRALEASQKTIFHQDKVITNLEEKLATQSTDTMNKCIDNLQRITADLVSVRNLVNETVAMMRKTLEAQQSNAEKKNQRSSSPMKDMAKNGKVSNRKNKGKRHSVSFASNCTGDDVPSFSEPEEMVDPMIGLSDFPHFESGNNETMKQKIDEIANMLGKNIVITPHQKKPIIKQPDNSLAGPRSKRQRLDPAEKPDSAAGTNRTVVEVPDSNVVNAGASTSKASVHVVYLKKPKSAKSRKKTSRSSIGSKSKAKKAKASRPATIPRARVATTAVERPSRSCKVVDNVPETMKSEHDLNLRRKPSGVNYEETLDFIDCEENVSDSDAPMPRLRRQVEWVSYKLSDIPKEFYEKQPRICLSDIMKKDGNNVQMPSLKDDDNVPMPSLDIDNNAPKEPEAVIVIDNEEEYSVIDEDVDELLPVVIETETESKSEKDLSTTGSIIEAMDSMVSTVIVEFPDDDDD